MLNQALRVAGDENPRKKECTVSSNGAGKEEK